MKTEVAGLMAGFDKQEDLLNAAKQAHATGYRHMDAYSPFPIEEMPRAMKLGRTPIPLIVLVGGMIGGLGGYFMEWYAAVKDYPVEVGGRPLHSWPAFIPITFELTVLCAALSAIVSMLVLNRLPRLHHPVFNVPAFARASTDKFFFWIEASDPMYDPVATRSFLERLHPFMITEVEA